MATVRRKSTAGPVPPPQLSTTIYAVRIWHPHLGRFGPSEGEYLTAEEAERGREEQVRRFHLDAARVYVVKVTTIEEAVRQP